MQFVFLLVLALISCAANNDAGDVVDEPEYHTSLATELVEDKLVKYDKLLANIKEKQTKFNLEYPKADKQHQSGLVALAREYVSTTLCDSIWSHWYGTDWDFYGTTETPGKGNIVCGYFVTTTLKHVGYNIDRVTLAQQAASVIITTMCGKGKTKIIGNNNTEELVAYMNEQSDGVYICGLDNHVGFIQKQGDKIYFVHSSGLSNQLKVMKEKRSRVVTRSNILKLIMWVV